jgi:hypothetical protein
LLHELSTDAQQSTVSKLLGAVFQQSLERVARCRLSFFVDGVFDLRGFSAYGVFVNIKLPGIGMKASQDGECFIRAVVGDEPVRCQLKVLCVRFLGPTSEVTQAGTGGSMLSQERTGFAAPVGI